MPRVFESHNMPKLIHWFFVGIEISERFTWKMSSTSRKMVVLPTPLGPSNPNNSPPLTLNKTLSTAITGPNLLLTRWRSTIGITSLCSLAQFRPSVAHYTPSQECYNCEHIPLGEKIQSNKYDQYAFTVALLIRQIQHI